jgi:hypothetical protein
MLKITALPAYPNVRSLEAAIESSHECVPPRNGLKRNSLVYVRATYCLLAARCSTSIGTDASDHFRRGHRVWAGSTITRWL